MQVRTLPMALGFRPDMRTLGVLSTPMLFAAGFILTVFADDGPTLTVLWRPLFIAVGFAVATQLVAMVVLRSARRGTAAALVALIAVVAPGFGLLAVAALIAVELARRWSKPIPALRAVSVGVALFFVLSVARTATAPGFDVGLSTPEAAALASPVEGDPDIYVLLLDGYPRSDTLAAEAGYDNAWFEAELEKRGFDVSTDSHGNYPYTMQVLASMLHAQHLSDLVRQPPAESVEQGRRIAELISSNPTFDRLRERGYQIHHLPRESTRITIFEHQVLRRTALWGLLIGPVLLPDHRAFILGTLREIEATPAEAEPAFVWSHVLSPHTPIVFDRDGEMPDLDYEMQWAFDINRELMGLSADDFWRAYADQVHYLNGRVLDAIDAILDVSPDAVIFTFSDHGARSTSDQSDEWYQTFLAARTPGHPDLLSNDARAQDIIPALFGAYFGDELEAPPDVTYAAPGGWPMPLTVVEYDD